MVLGRTAQGDQIDWVGNAEKIFTIHVPVLDTPLGLSKNFAALLIAMAWRHIGYVMVLYLAGLKSVDPSLREAAAIDGCNEWQSFRRVVFPVMKPINVVVFVITVIEALRAFDIIVALKKPPGTQVLGILVRDNLVGEGGGQVGLGSAYGVILLLLCLGFIIWYLVNNYRENEAMSAQLTVVRRQPRRARIWRVGPVRLPDVDGAAVVGAGGRRDLRRRCGRTARRRSSASSRCRRHSRCRTTGTPGRRAAWRRAFGNTMFIVIPSLILILVLLQHDGVRRQPLQLALQRARCC